MKRGTPKHPKVLDLCDRLGCDRPLAIGYLELLWHFAAEFAPQGDIGRFTDKRIEGALDWAGRGRHQGRLIQALIDSRWIDADVEVCEVKRKVQTVDGKVRAIEPEVRQCNDRVRLLVHDWSEHADESVVRKLARANQGFLELREKVTGQSADGGRKHPAAQPDESCLPYPKPYPKPEPQPQPAVSLPRAVEFPLTDAVIHELFPSAPDTLVVEVAHLTAQEYISAVNGAEGMPDITDDLIAAAVKVAYFPKMENPRAFRTLAPRVMRSWAEEELRKQTH
jgi:hypothetical protein